MPLFSEEIGFRYLVSHLEKDDFLPIASKSLQVLGNFIVNWIERKEMLVKRLLFVCALLVVVAGCSAPNNGVTIKVDRTSASADSMTYRLHNASDATYPFEKSYIVRRHKDASWQAVPFTEAFERELAKKVVRPGETEVVEVPMDAFQEPLRPGKYRITQTLFDEDGEAFHVTVSFPVNS